MQVRVESKEQPGPQSDIFRVVLRSPKAGQLLRTMAGHSEVQSSSDATETSQASVCGDAGKPDALDPPGTTPTDRR